MNLHEKEVIVRTMERENFNAGEFVVRQGELGTSFYIILSGSLDVITHDVKPGKTIKAAKLSNRSARLLSLLLGNGLEKPVWCAVCQEQLVSALLQIHHV